MGASNFTRKRARDSKPLSEIFFELPSKHFVRREIELSLYNLWKMLTVST